MWRVVASGHFIYSFKKQLSPHHVPGTALGIADEAVIETRFLPS